MAATKASGQRKGTTVQSKSRASTKKKTSGKQAKKKTEPESFLKDEVILLIVLAVSILLLLGCFKVGGIFGKGVNFLMFGMFGIMSYIMPVFLFFGTAFFISNKGNTIATIKLIACVLLFISVCTFFELILVHDISGMKISQCFGYSQTEKTGGGLLGGLFARMFITIFGLIGAYVVDIILLIISIVLITEKSFFRGLQYGGQKVYQTAIEEADRHRERSRERRERQEIEENKRRMDKKVSGVSFDLDLCNTTKASLADEMEEITIDGAPIAEQKLDGSYVDIFASNHKTEKSATHNDIAPVPVRESVHKPEAIIKAEPIMKEPSVFKTDALSKQESVTKAEDISRSEPIVTAESVDKPEVLSPVTSPQEEKQNLTKADFSEQIVKEKESHREELEDIPVVEQTMAELEAMDVPKDDTVVSPYKSNIQVEEEQAQTAPLQVAYEFPPLDLLKSGNGKEIGDSQEYLRATAMKLQQTLQSFGVRAKVTNVSCGPAVTRYEIQPEQGVKVSKIVGLTDDIKLNLAAADIRIEAPIPGKAAVGIELPNKESSAVMLRDLLEDKSFQEHSSPIAFAVGKDIGGQNVVTDIAKMPHLLIAGSTGSGKSVCINTIIMSILYKARPDQVKLIMVDPKVVELSVYNGIPHLLIPVVTDPKKAAGALNWAVAEMDARYQKFAAVGVRGIEGYNEKVDALQDIEGEKPEKLPQIVIIVDELADLMMVASGDVEAAIVRLSQLARAAGIHLIIATQRPSVNVITGLIKANMPSRIAFAVSSSVDSRTILDMGGAEKLLGKGDMLFFPQGYQKPVRVQCAFVSDKEVSRVVEFLSSHYEGNIYSSDIEEKIQSASQSASGIAGGDGDGPERDPKFEEAGKFIIEKDKASIGMLQRVFKVGFNRAARIMDQLADAGVVGEEEGTKPRKVLMSMEEFEQYIEEYL